MTWQDPSKKKERAQSELKHAGTGEGSRNVDIQVKSRQKNTEI